MTSPSTSAAVHRLARRLVVLVAAASVLLVGPAATGVEARDDGGPTDETLTWGISPAGPDGRDDRSAIAHVTEPGSRITEHVVVDNFGDEPLVVDLYGADARPAGGSFDVDTADEPAEAVGAWIALDATTIEVPARGEVIVELVIDVPHDATPGDHAGGVLASRRTAGSSQDVGFATERRVGTRVHLRIDGPITAALEVTDLRVTHSQGLDPRGRGTTEVTYRITNPGNLRLGGRVEVTTSAPLGLGRRRVAGPSIDDLLPGHWSDHVVVIDGVVPLGRLRTEVVVTPTHSGGQPLDGTVGSHVAASSTTVVPIAPVVLVAVGLVGLWGLRRRRRSSGGADATVRPWETGHAAPTRSTASSTTDSPRTGSSTRPGAASSSTSSPRPGGR